MELSADSNELYILRLIFRAGMPQRDARTLNQVCATLFGGKGYLLFHEQPNGAKSSGAHQAAL